MTFEVSGYEIAYTPKNLRIMLSRNIISQREAYEAIGVSRCMFYRYLRPYGHPNHSDMPSAVWNRCGDYVNQKRYEKIN